MWARNRSNMRHPNPWTKKLSVGSHALREHCNHLEISSVNRIHLVCHLGTVCRGVPLGHLRNIWGKKSEPEIFHFVQIPNIRTAKPSVQLASGLKHRISLQYSNQWYPTFDSYLYIGDKINQTKQTSKQASRRERFCLFWQNQSM